MATVLDCPHPLPIERAGPTKGVLAAGARRLHRLAASLLAGRGVNRHEGVRPLVWIRSDHHHVAPSLSSQPLKVDLRRTRLSRGDATLLSSHAGDPEPAASDTTRAGQTNNWPTRKL